MIKYILSSFLLIVLFNSANSRDIYSYLIPQPKKLEILNQFSVKKTSKIGACEAGEIIEALANNKLKIRPCIDTIIDQIYIGFRLLDTITIQDAYVIEITPNGILVSAKELSGLFYGKQTLIQVMHYAHSEQITAPCLFIFDYPDFKRRGYMLDISRDKVPTMQTLFLMVDYLAQWKINELQLYTEHTFAYKNHEEVWKDASPLTAEEVRILDSYCRLRFIDLVPNQNSFGHMEKWLEHDNYKHLAECPTDCKTIWGDRKLTSFNPLNDSTFYLMQELYAELLPNFTSRYFNIGCDETVELGLGRSKDTCDKYGKGQIYLQFLKKLNTEVIKNGRQTQFWGDIILNHPELIPDIPKDMIALDWGYDIDYPFEKHLEKFKNAGLEFYVCPGTSSWQSLIGRNYNAFGNIRKAAINGKTFGARGFMNTNWGDHGHWQPLSVCIPATMLGAAYAWSMDDKTEQGLEFLLNHYVFKDKTENTAKALLILGNAYRAANIPEGNGNAFHLLLFRYAWTMKGNWQTKLLTKEGLVKCEQIIDSALTILENASPQSVDASVTISEIKQASALAKHAIHLGKARLETPDQTTQNIDSLTKVSLATELENLNVNQRNIWIIRNRPGGLDDSMIRLEKLLATYKETAKVEIEASK